MQSARALPQRQRRCGGGGAAAAAAARPRAPPLPPAPQRSAAAPPTPPGRGPAPAAAVRNAKRLKYAGVGQRVVVGEPLFLTLQVRAAQRGALRAARCAACGSGGAPAPARGMAERALTPALSASPPHHAPPGSRTRATRGAWKRSCSCSRTAGCAGRGGGAQGAGGGARAAAAALQCVDTGRKRRHCRGGPATGGQAVGCARPSAAPFPCPLPGPRWASSRPTRCPRSCATWKTATRCSSCTRACSWRPRSSSACCAGARGAGGGGARPGGPASPADGRSPAAAAAAAARRLGAGSAGDPLQPLPPSPPAPQELPGHQPLHHRLPPAAAAGPARHVHRRAPHAAGAGAPPPGRGARALALRNNGSGSTPRRGSCPQAPTPLAPPP
jgi:hypothetical protein